MFVKTRRAFMVGDHFGKKTSGQTSPVAVVTLGCLISVRNLTVGALKG